MKNILVLIHDDAGQEARLQAGLDLVRALGGHLVCVDVVGVGLDAGYPGPEAAAILVGQEERKEAVNRARIEARLTGEDVPWSIERCEGSYATCIRRAGTLADLLVLNPELQGEGPDMPVIAGNLLMKSGKPVLVVPETSRGIDLSGGATVAWDGSLPAMAALTAAIPLLRLAKEVRLLEIQGSSEGALEEAARYLSRHGIAPEIDRVACFRDAPHETSAIIQDLCAQAGSSWCVMGAYGHSPLREALLGGTTRHMLATARLPVFLAH
jgi:nucleotide-binding universal stress UspA family protein